MAKAKKGLECYFSVRSAAPDIFSDRDPDTKAFKRTFDYT